MKEVKRSLIGHLSYVINYQTTQPAPTPSNQHLETSALAPSN
jgi:hypothetical protein